MLMHLVEYCSHWIPAVFISQQAGADHFPMPQFIEYMQARAIVKQMEHNKRS